MHSMGKWMAGILAAMMLCGAAIMGCSDEGTAEKAGKQIDRAVDDAKDSIKKAFD